MNKFGLFVAALTMSVVAHATSISPTQEKLDVSSIDQTIRMAETRDNEGTLRKVSIIINDNGLSTDVSPRYSIYLAYNSLAEMGNLHAAYKITDLAYYNVTAKKVSPGIYEVRFEQYREEQGMVKVIQTIDATAVYAADKTQRNKCGMDFCDGEIKADITVTEKVVPSK